MVFFQSLTEPLVRDGLERAKGQAQERRKAEYDLAIDFMQGRALDHVESELKMRYPGHQDQKVGERIHPVHIPIVEQYLAEAASTYNRNVKRTLIDIESDAPDDEATTAFAKMPGMSKLNPRLHVVDQVAVLLASCALWPQVKRGRLVPRVIVPQNIHPVANHLDQYADAADPDDYLGFVLQLEASADNKKSEPQRFVMLGAANHVYYTGKGPYEIHGAVTKIANPFEWVQIDDERDGGVPTGKGAEVTAPLQMLTFWYNQEPLEELIPDVDASVAVLNLEIDIAMSAMLHDLRMHGGAQMFMSLIDPQRPPARLAFGSNFVIPLQSGESLGYAGSPINYEMLIETLNAFIELFARSKRMDPNQFSFERKGAESGFAKAVASLPKIEARNERQTLLKVTEEEILWPRLGSIADWLDVLPKPASAYRMQTEFEELKFPQNVEEKTKEDEHNFKHGLDSPVAKLARERGITEDQAQELMAKHRESAPQQQQESIGGRFGQSIARRNRRPGGPAGADQRGASGNPRGGDRDEPPDAG